MASVRGMLMTQARFRARASATQLASLASRWALVVASVVAFV